MIHKKNTLITNTLITNTIILITILTTQSMLHAKVGCLSDSYAAKKFDNTEHFVACDCKCTRTLAKQDRCVRCNHSHVPQSWIIIPDTTTESSAQTTASHTKNSYSINPVAPYIVMNNLIAQYKNKTKTTNTQVQE